MNTRPPSAYVRFDESCNEWQIVDADSSQILWASDEPHAQTLAESAALRMQKQGEIILLETPQAPRPQAFKYGGDAVNHPDHYGGEDNPYEAIKVIEAWKLDFCLGNTVKYISRMGKKVADGHSGPNARLKKDIEDLKKARWYLERRIQQLEEANAPA